MPRNTVIDQLDHFLLSKFVTNPKLGLGLTVGLSQNVFLIRFFFNQLLVDYELIYCLFILGGLYILMINIFRWLTGHCIVKLLVRVFSKYIAFELIFYFLLFCIWFKGKYFNLIWNYTRLTIWCSKLTNIQFLYLAHCMPLYFIGLYCLFLFCCACIFNPKILIRLSSMIYMVCLFYIDLFIFSFELSLYICVSSLFKMDLGNQVTWRSCLLFYLFVSFFLQFIYW